MIGIRNSKLGICLLGGLVSAALGDDISLTGDASLSGTIRSISGQGVVELSTPLSPDAVLLKPEAVEEVKFSPPQDRPEVPGAMVELVNGDQLPVVIESLDEKSLTVATPDAGRIVIPREALKSLQVGVHRQRTVYTGPKSAEEWTSDPDSTRAWKFDNNALVASGPAFASKNVNTPSQFVLKFSIKWQGNPNLQVYFADPLRPRGEAADRYYLQFAGAGMELKRESTTGNRFTTVILSNKTPDQFPDNKIDLEIRVDRKTARLHLLINGEVEGAGVDPTSAPPEGRGIALVSNISNGYEQEVSAIEIAELDDARGRHRSEPRGMRKLIA